MLKKISLSLFLGFCFIAGAFAADKLAIVQPAAKGGVPDQEIEAIWGMLEANVDGGYELISRGALKQMLTEIEFTENTNFTNLNSTQTAKLGEIKTVKYILVSTVAKLGSRINLTLTVMDASTGEIEKDRRASITADNLDDLSDKLKDTLREMGLGTDVKKRGICAILIPIIRVAGAPAYLTEDFNTGLESYLLDNSVRLQNLKNVNAILSKNKIGDLSEAEPAMYARVGELLRVDTLIQPTVTRFSATIKQEYIQVTRRTATRCIGNLEGNVRIISAQTGELIASIPFKERVDFDDVERVEDTEDWTQEDYGKYMIEQMLPEIGKRIVAKLNP